MFVATFQGHVVVPVEYRTIESASPLGTMVHNENGDIEWIETVESVLMVRAEMCSHQHGHFGMFLASEIVVVEKRTDPEKMSEVTGWGKCCRELMIAEIFKGRNA